MNKIKYVVFAALALALMAMPALAQGAADNESSVAAAKAIGGGIGFGLAAGLLVSDRASSVRVPLRVLPVTLEQPEPSRR